MSRVCTRIAPSTPPQRLDHPTLWGLTPAELHDRFWAARGVQIVRSGEPSRLIPDVELYLLMAPDLLTVFRLRVLLDQLNWIDPEVLWVRLHHPFERPYREVVQTDEQDTFLGIQRAYGGSDARLARVAVTPRRRIAQLWQETEDPVAGWRRLRQVVPRLCRHSASVQGTTYDRRDEAECMAFVHELLGTWQSPSATVHRARRVAPGIWRDETAELAADARFVGPSWIGAGRRIGPDTRVVGPAVLWDDPDARPRIEPVDWESLEPADTFGVPIRRPTVASWHGICKRGLDLVVALLGLLAVGWLFPLIALAIWLEDGHPIFFAHRREGRHGRVFGCLKFRSMRQDAEQVRRELSASNQADGPQFFIAQDPRVTHVGRFLRRYHLDELPQLLNVVAGSMSLVGPRPSPYYENQCCPAWREARLSVLPGMTGLWQVKRTRQPGRDFQEWIQYDTEYVEKASLWLDAWILFQTARQLLCK